jgi:hypothetical protein
MKGIFIPTGRPLESEPNLHPKEWSLLMVQQEGKTDAMESILEMYVLELTGLVPLKDGFGGKN